MIKQKEGEMDQDPDQPHIVECKSGRSTWYNHLAALILLLGIGSTIAGIYFLEVAHSQIMLGYSLLINGCAWLVFMPRSFTLATCRPALKPIAIACHLAGATLFVLAVMTVCSSAPIVWSYVMATWIGSIVCCLLGFALWEITRTQTNFKFSKLDLNISAVIFLVALLCRAFMLVTRSPIAIEDELQVFGANLAIGGGAPSVSPLSTLNSFPGLFYWLMYILYQPFAPLIDLYDFEKLCAASAGALSIAAWFLVLRMHNSRPLALCASVMLCFFGWHWLNSRFLYSYPFDLALISVTTLCIFLSIEKNNLFLAVLAGITSFLCLIFQKIGIMIFPFIGYVLLDYFMSRSETNRKRVVTIGLTWLGTALLIYLPVIIYSIGPNSPEGLLPRHSSILGGRAQSLASAGISSLDSFFLMSKDVFFQLQVQEFDHARHLFRDKAPLLDPVFSALFMLGLILLLRNVRLRRDARICLAGFALFTLPMILSFPTDGGLEHGLNHRMLGVSLFVAWMAAAGAELITHRLFSNRFQKLGMALLCCASCFLNVRFLFSAYIPASAYPLNTGKDLGVQRASTLKTVRSLAKSGLTTLYLFDHRPLVDALSTKDIRVATHDLPNIVNVDSIEHLRTQLAASSGKPLFIVIPGSSVFLDKYYQDIPTQLADVIPTHLWVPGLLDHHGIPTSWQAFVRAP